MKPLWRKYGPPAAPSARVRPNRPRPAVRSERVEQQHIVQLSRTLGARVYVLGTTRRRGDYQGTMQTPGLPDLYLLWPASPYLSDGCALWWEVKRAKGKRTIDQEQFAYLCSISGATYGWGTYDDFVEWCRAHGRLRGEIGRTA